LFEVATSIQISGCFDVCAPAQYQDGENHQASGRFDHCTSSLEKSGKASWRSDEMMMKEER
jgi:hypothetical protein